MIPKIVWPGNRIKGNPFGGIDGFRPLTITFHSASFDNVSSEDKKALDILLLLAKREQINAMSFGGEISPKISIELQRSEHDDFTIRVIGENEKVLSGAWVPKSWIRNCLLQAMRIYSPQEEEKHTLVRQGLLEVGAHWTLKRDLFITGSQFLIDKRDRLNADLNIRTPLEALKIVHLYLRTRNPYEWVAVVGKNKLLKLHDSFHESLAKALLPNIYRYVSSLGLHSHHEELTQLGRSIFNRCSRALQARDEIARLFYMRETPGFVEIHSSNDQRIYHFDYLTLLLTAALDVEALVISQLYDFKTPTKRKVLSPGDCSFSAKRENFRTAIQNEPRLRALEDLLGRKKDYIDILFELRNKIHSISLEASFYLPDEDKDPYPLLNKIYKYDLVSHWGINISEKKIPLIKNNAPPVDVYDISIEIHTLAHHLIDEGFDLIDKIMKETNIEPFLDPADIGKIQDKQASDDFTPTSETCLLLG